MSTPKNSSNKESIYEIPLSLLKKDIYKALTVSLFILIALLGYAFTR